jgi:hypothetical protein
VIDGGEPTFRVALFEDDVLMHAHPIGFDDFASARRAAARLNTRDEYL